MNDITPIARSAPSALGPTARSTAGPAVIPAGTARSGDKVEFSQAAQLLSKLAELPDVRQDLVNRVRAEIASGSYDTPDKVDALLDDLAEDLT